jgi:hypothetical protein
MYSRTLFALVLSTAAAPLGAQRAPDIAPYLTPDRAAEIALARSAAPSDISANATVLVLTRTGYTEAVHGTNGFTCAVMRSFAGAADDPQFWNPHTSAPLCMNPPAARTVLPGLLTRIGWALAGATPAALRTKISQAYASKTFTLPAPGAMAYMLSPRQHLSDADPQWVPHAMFYYDRSVATGAFGPPGDTAPIIDASPADANTPVRVVLIPTRAWSDGTPATTKTATKTAAKTAGR